MRREAQAEKAPRSPWTTPPQDGGQDADQERIRRKGRVRVRVRERIRRKWRATAATPADTQRVAWCPRMSAQAGRVTAGASQK